MTTMMMVMASVATKHVPAAYRHVTRQQSMWGKRDSNPLLGPSPEVSAKTGVADGVVSAGSFEYPCKQHREPQLVRQTSREEELIVGRQTGTVYR